jgi:hypothetical protein
MTSNLDSPLYGYDSPWASFEPGMRLQELREFAEAGVAPAIHDAWSLITDNELAVPDWLAAPTAILIAKALPKGQVSYRSKMKHYYRWRTVKRLRAENSKRGDVFEDASTALLGTQYHCGRDAIEASYKKVQKELKDPKAAIQYYTAMSATRELMGTSFRRKKV